MPGPATTATSSPSAAASPPRCARRTTQPTDSPRPADPGARTGVGYVVQSHAHPHLVERLVGTLLREDPAAVVVLNHDSAGCVLPPALLAHPSVALVPGTGGRGDVGLVLRWLDAARWLRDHARVDHVVTLSGQDYPVRPLGELHAALLGSGDGFLEHFPVLERSSHWPVREGRSRYLYAWRTLRPLGPRARARLRPLHVLNRLQPWWRVNVAYDALRIGRRAGSGLPPGWQPWGGSFFTNLSWRAVERVLAAAEDDRVMGWARRSLVADEAFLQTVLLNDGSFALEDTSGRFYDFAATSHGSPATLATLADVRRARASGAFFARKWDPATPAQVWAALDCSLSADRGGPVGGNT